MSVTQRRGEGSLLKAALFVNLGVLLFSVMAVFIKVAGVHFEALQIATVRNVAGAVIVFALLGHQLKWAFPREKVLIRQWPLALSRGVTVSLAQLAYFFAITKVELATVQTIAYSTPLFVTALSVPFLGDRVGAWRWGAVAFGFVGVILVLQPYNLGFSWVLLLPLFAASMYGSNLVTVRMFDSNVSTLLVNNYSSLVAVVMSVIYLLLFSNGDWNAPWQAWAAMLAVGLCGGFGIYLISAGYREVAPSKVAPFDYFGLLYALLFGFWFFGEAPFDRLFPGVLLIIGAGFLILWREQVRKNHR